MSANYILNPSRVCAYVELVGVRGWDKIKIEISNVEYEFTRENWYSDDVMVSIGGDGKVKLPSGQCIGRVFFDEAIKFFSIMYGEKKKDIIDSITWYTSGKYNPVGMVYRRYMAVIAQRADCYEEE